VTKAQSKLNRWRRIRGLTQEELRDRSGVPVRTIGRIERNEVRTPPKLPTLVNLARALDIDVTELLEERWLAWNPTPRYPAPPPPNPAWPDRLQRMLNAEQTRAKDRTRRGESDHRER
jgi:transcriptional regulator with XRE-family HTH domain